MAEQSVQSVLPAEPASTRVHKRRRRLSRFGWIASVNLVAAIAAAAAAVASAIAAYGQEQEAAEATVIQERATFTSQIMTSQIAAVSQFSQSATQVGEKLFRDALIDADPSDDKSVGDDVRAIEISIAQVKLVLPVRFKQTLESIDKNVDDIDDADTVDDARRDALAVFKSLYDVKTDLEGCAYPIFMSGHALSDDNTKRCKIQVVTVSVPLGSRQLRTLQRAMSRPPKHAH